MWRKSYRKPMRQQMVMRPRGDDDAAKSGLDLRGRSPGCRGRCLVAPYAEGPKSYNSQYQRTSGGHIGEGLRAMSPGGGSPASPGAASEAAGLFPVPRAEDVKG